MTDSAVSPEAYEAAARALLKAGQIQPTDPAVRERSAKRLADHDVQLRAAVDAVWSLGVAEGRRQAAEAIRTTIFLGRPGISDIKEWAARIAEGNTDATHHEGQPKVNSP